MAQFSNCLSIISRMSERDQDSLVARLDELQAQGVPAEKAQIQAAIDVLMRAEADAAGIQRSAARTKFNGEDVEIRDRNRWSIYEERSAQLGDGYMRWVEDPDMAYITDIQAGPTARGKKMLEWLSEDSGKNLYAVGVVDDSIEFWDKMEEEGIIEGQSDENFVDYFGLRRSAARDVTETPEFRRWFGESKAVEVVSESTGLPPTSSKEKTREVPQVMYHTTRNDFSEFEVGRTTINSGTFGDWETTRSAVFVTPELEASQAYGKRAGKFAEGANVMPLYIKAENPLDLSAGVIPYDIELQFEGIDFNPRWLYRFDWSKFDDEGGADFVRAAKQLGYDSVIFNDENPETGDSFEAWAVFEPTQIKSATGNNGAFDPADPNITRSVSRDAYAWRNSIDTSVGPLLQGEDFYLLPQREITQDDFGDNGFAANGLMGHAERAVPGTRTIAYRIVGDNGIIGTLVSDVDPAGVLRSVHDIEIADRRGGIGSKIVATIAANTQSPIKIQDITDEADTFWTRIGVGYKDQYGDAFLDWEDVAQYLGARRAAQIDPDATPAEGRGRGLQEGSYEVSELSPEEASSFFKFSLPRAIIAGDLGSLNSDQDYAAAKGGDLDAALRLAGRVVDAGLVERLGDIESPIVVGVSSIEASGRNAIPQAAAGIIASRIDAERDASIIQSSAPKRTALAGLDRIFNRPEFDGDVESDRNYILVDDTITQGGTFAALGQHIEAGGGNVAAVVALSGKQYSAILSVDEQTLNTLREKFGDVENEFEQATGYGFGGLTQSEARYLASFKPTDAVRTRILEEAGQGAGSQDRGAPGQEVARSIARPAFYSQLQRAIEQVPDRLATMAAPQWKLWLDANAAKLGVKKDEIEWSGIGDYLKLRGKDKVTREDLVAYLADSGVRVQEVVLGSTGLRDTGEMYVAEANDWGDEWAVFTEDGSIIGGTYESQGAAEQAMDEMNSEGKPTKYGSYTVPGGERYREVLITLPEKRPEDQAARRERRNAALAVFPPTAESRAILEETRGDTGAANAYKSSHWDAPNVLAHIRVDDRVDADGARVLFIGEFQSDWGQQAKKDGIRSNYKAEDVELLPADDPESVQPEFFWYFKVPGNVLQIPKSKYATSAEAREYIIREKPVNPSGVPAAPFISDTKAWASLALKRAIMMAVEEGHDKIAIITGEQAAGLYSLDKQISKVEYLPETNVLRAFDPNGRSVYDQETAPDKIEDVIGKEIAAKLLESEPYTSGSGKKVHRLEGVDLKAPAAGMRKFYDELIPQVARDVLKKLGGGKLEEVSINAGVNADASEIRWSEDTDGIQTIEWDGGERQFDTEDEARTFRDGLISNRTTQTGFTITPAMREKVASGVPLFSKGRTSTGADWESPSASKFDDLVYKFQDKQIETKRVVEAIKDASGAISDDLNVYLNEELYHGRTAKRTEDFLNMELNPLIEEMAKANMKIADLEEFLHARHAKEANAVIAQRNPGEPGLQDGGSGMTNAEADKYMAALPAADRAVLEAAAAKVDAIIAGTRKMFVDYELESKATVDGWNSMFKHYVPLQREDKEGSPGLGQGFSIKGKETKGRTGSTRKVVDILANIAMQRERAIVRGEKNRVAQSLVGLARANENPDFWMVDEVPTERVFNPKTGLVEDRVDPMYKSRENAVVAKIKDPGGVVREHAVLFNEEDPRALRMAQALKNLDAQQLNGLLGVSAKITRYFAAVSTQYNPVFGVVNLVRDVQGAMLNLSSTPLKDDKAKIAKYTASALSGIYGDMRAARKGRNQTSAWAALWDEFQEVGGQTGYRDMFATSADRAEAIQKALDPATWMDSKLGKVFTANGALKVPMAQAQKQAGFIFDWLSDYNNAMENGVRLAAYKAGLERGMTKRQAASAAKNLTTNFNRKGQAAQQAGAMYAFFNAAIQGTARIGRTLFDMEPGKPKTIRLSSAGKKIVYGGILLGAIQALALAAAGFNDDDPPEFARERSLIIPIGGKKYISIPMPLGFHVLPSIGRISTEFMLSGFKDPHKRALSLASLFAEAFNPIGNAGLSMQTLAPTALDPLVALTENRDWTGRPIARESSNKAIPGHALGRDTATSVAKLLSEAINTLSGGNKYTSGVFSPTPDQIDYLIGQATGGVGRELSKVEQTVLSTARGESLPTYKVPLVGRFIGDAKSQASEGTAFYANTERLNRIETEMKGLQKDGKIAEATALRMSHSEAYLITMANQAERQIQKLRAEKRELVKANAPRDRVKAIEDRITAVMARLNRAMESLQEKQEN